MKQNVFLKNLIGFIQYFFYFVTIYIGAIERPIAIIIPSYNNANWAVANIHSATTQNYNNFRIIYIDDCSTDSTYEIIKNYIDNNHLENKISLLRNQKRQGALSNLYHAIHSCQDHEIVATLDGDDWFPHEHVLTRLNQEYSNSDVWLTYGQFMFYPSNKVGYCTTIPTDVIQSQRYRNYQWLTSHLRTFYAGLFKKIKIDDLQINGQFYPVTWDQAMILPMLEMAGTHIRFIPDILYIYNYNNPLNDEKTSLPLVLHCEKQIRSKPCYARLDHLVLQGPDLIIFSFDRPLQLYALLESIELNAPDLSSINVLYRTSSVSFNDAYEQVRKDFLHVNFIKQGSNPRQDFKPLLLKVFNESTSPYVIFAVDDIIIQEKISFKDCIEQLEKYHAYGFFLRLGLNLNYCYPLQCYQPLPIYNVLPDNTCSWQFKTGKHDWNYPHTVDMTLYRKNDIKNDLNTLNYSTPNTFEGEWACVTQGVENKIGLCYTKSKIVNLPLNQVNMSPNVCMHCLSPQELLSIFHQGLKIDIECVKNIEVKSAHVPYKPIFIAQKKERENETIVTTYFTGDR